MRKNAFTLIELLAVIVILAIISLIAVPIVLGIINDTKKSSMDESVKMYIKAFQSSLTKENINAKLNPSSCTINSNGDALCDGVLVEVKMEGEKPTDGIIYLSNGKVQTFEKLKYGSQYVFLENNKYNYYEKNLTAGSPYKYNNIDFLVIKDNINSVVLLKAEPLTVNEVNTYGVGHVNNYTIASGGAATGSARNTNGYGGMQGFGMETCGYVNGQYMNDCPDDYVGYEKSNIKYVVDGWANDKINVNDVILYKNKYTARLLIEEEVLSSTSCTRYNQTCPEWLYSNDYSFWVIRNDDNQRYFDAISPGGTYNGASGLNNYYTESKVVRPVIELKKTPIK